MKTWARLIHSNVSSRQSPRSFDFHVTRNSNRNWHSGMPLAASIIYLYTRKIHGRAHTFSLSTIHETSCLLWPFDQQYFCMKQEQSCVPLDQQAYSELMRSGHRKHVSFGRLALPSINQFLISPFHKTADGLHERGQRPTSSSFLPQT